MRCVATINALVSRCRRRATAAVAFVAVALGMPATSCTKQGTPTTPATTAPDVHAAAESKCGAHGSAGRALVVALPAEARAMLGARVGQGLVAVRYVGCDMEVLPDCAVPGAYSYVGTKVHRNTVRIRTIDELHAKLPVGASTMESVLERTGQIDVDMVIVGRSAADRRTFAASELEGRCSEATHVVTGLTLGAFTLSTGASSAGLEVQKQDGDVDSCKLAGQDPGAPPVACSAVISVEVVPIDRV